MTSHAIPFDTLAYVKDLETAGVPAPQAEAHAKALSATLQQVEDARQSDLATRGDVGEVRLETEKVRRDLALEIEKVRREIAETKADILKWVAGMFVAQTALILGALIKLLPCGH